MGLDGSLQRRPAPTAARRYLGDEEMKKKITQADIERAITAPHHTRERLSMLNGSRTIPVLLSQMGSKDLELLAMMCHAAIHYPNDYSEDADWMAEMKAFYNLVAHELELRDLR
jgi:hypothetical protein